MTPDERMKAISTMVAGVARHPMIENEFKVGLAAMAEELLALRAWCDILERSLIDR